MRSEIHPFIFIRADVFYVLDLPITDDFARHAAQNPGTLRIEDAATKRVVWSVASDN